MSFLTEYFDEYRPKPIKKTKMCRPELRWAKLEGKWLDPKKGGAEEKVWSDEEIQAFIKKTMKSLRGRSTYFNEYCGHLDPEIASRPFVPRVKKLPLCSELDQGKAEEPPAPPAAKLALKDTEVMKMAGELYDQDMDRPTLEPLPTHLRSDIGNASKMNSVLQVVGGVSLAALAEGLALADRAGLNQADLLDVLALTPLASPHLILKGRAMIESSYSTHQPLSHMQKDLKLALALGDALEQSLPLTATTNEIFKHAKRLGYANHDVAAVYIRARF